MSTKKKITKLKNKLMFLKDKNFQTDYEKIITEDSIKYAIINSSKVEREKNKDEENSKKIVPINLSDRVDKFIDWYYENMVEGFYTNVGEYNEPRKMRDFIEKVAVWYELRYPSYEVNRKLHCCGQEKTEASKIMFQDNRYLEIMDNTEEIQELDWEDFYNTKAFISSLPADEKAYLKRPYYPEIVFWSSNVDEGSLRLSKKGTILDSQDLEKIDKDFTKKNLIGKNIKEFLEIVKSKKIDIPKNSQIKKSVQYYDKWLKQKDKMLNAIMYRIIERGGNRIGPRRGFLFAQEFKRNIDIPMMYAVDTTDPGLRDFVNEYIRLGGTKKLVCYKNYFSRANKSEKVKIIKVEDLIKFLWANEAEKYTKEEHDLHQKLVNLLTSQINFEELTRQKRLVKKLENSKKKRD